MWLSLVEHLVRDEGVAGSNPATPTKQLPKNQRRLGRIANGFDLPGQLSGQKTRSHESWAAEGTADGVSLSVYNRQLGTKYADIAPPLSTADFEALRDSILMDGVQVPIVVDGATGEIIDGKHRYLIDQNCPRVTVDDLDTDAQRFAKAILLNDARRNMTREQRVEMKQHKRRIAAELSAEKDEHGAPRWSQAEIGAKIGESQ